MVTVRSDPPIVLTSPPARIGKGVSPEVAKFIRDFYIESDTKDLDAYVQFWTPDGEFEIFTHNVGREAIKKVREKSMPQYYYMTHTFQDIMCTEPNVAYVAGKLYFHRKADDVIADGTPWVSRFTFNNDPSNLKMTDYRAWVTYPTKSK